MKMFQFFFHLHVPLNYFIHRFKNGTILELIDDLSK